ncbi:hypothetical protein ZWY2020_020235 [Hordeum vulgare]|nr:hypothetical protein ZWY2020_020235 [Hordeum vulgare]
MLHSSLSLLQIWLSLPQPLCARWATPAAIFAMAPPRAMDFSGSGGCTTLYLVYLPPAGRSAVVKRLHMPPSPSPSSATITKSFCNEVLILCALRHPHLVRLHGFCADLRALLLIDDFVPNGTLSHHLHRRGTAAPPPLPWRPRSRRRSSTSTSPEWRDVTLADWVVSKIKTDKLRKVVDPHMLDEHPDVMPSMEAVAELAFWCVAPDKDDRTDAWEALAELRRIQGCSLSYQTTRIPL